MRLHPLHNILQILQHMQATGEYFPVDRCTGRTEQIALRAVANALAHPHEWFPLVDHHDSAPARTELRLRCQNIVERMGYSGFKFRESAISFGSAVWRG